jgi:hypothetical protein
MVINFIPQKGYKGYKYPTLCGDEVTYDYTLAPLRYNWIYVTCSKCKEKEKEFEALLDLTLLDYIEL